MKMKLGDHLPFDFVSVFEFEFVCSQSVANRLGTWTCASGCPCPFSWIGTGAGGRARGVTLAAAEEVVCANRKQASSAAVQVRAHLVRTLAARDSDVESAWVVVPIGHLDTIPLDEA